MEQTSVQKLARILKVLVIITFVCNIAALFLVPMAACMYESKLVDGGMKGASFLFEIAYTPENAVPLFMVLGSSWIAVWASELTAVLTLFLWVCGICTAVILWQGKRVLDTILKGEPFTQANAASLKRAAVCCFLISGAALLRLIWGFAFYQSVTPLFTYNALFIPIFLMAGLLCMVVSALFRQAAELKAENDLTI